MSLPDSSASDSPPTPSASHFKGDHGVDRNRRRILLGAPVLAGALAAPIADVRAQAGQPERWSAGWGCAPAGPPPSASMLTFTDQTLRLIVRTSLGGDRVRIRLSNEMGDTALRLASAHVGLRAGGAVVTAGTSRQLTFAGRTAVVIPAGAPVLSDPVSLPVAPLADLAISLYFPGTVQASTIHNAAYQASYASTTGNFGAQASFPVQRAFASWPFLTEVDVDRVAPVLVAVGDSVTDGVGSTSNGNRRWPDFLARRIQVELGSNRIGVVNRGIAANRLLADTPTTLLAGKDLLERFDRDVLSTAGVRGLAVLIGINDIVYSPSSAPIPVDDLIAGYLQLVARAHLHGIPVLGATLPPFLGFVYYTPAREAVRQAVNAWMRSALPFDLLADVDLALRDPDVPQRLRAAYDSGDRLHPNDVGYEALAATVPLPALSALMGA
ncbi:lysophospholipase L1-like esterase [Massilia sp. UYP11]|uniref:SGNH/GDSL hydrolase family protein n=1 Tax=Massilia sp. UYP11 TaxID=1756385 RepID=UPI003D2328F3